MRILAEARMKLGMEVAFVSEITGGRRVFRFVDEETQAVGLEVDGSDPCEDTYCSRIVDGRLPTLIHDAQKEPGAADLAVTKNLGIGAHVSVPIVFSDGSIYGTFCCFSQSPNDSLSNRDFELIRTMAGLVTEQLERDELVATNRRLASKRVRGILEGPEMAMVFQPIVDLNSLTTVGVEALARFEAEPRRTPDLWFNEAWTAGLGVDLEVTAARMAAAQLDQLPADVFLSINISPETALSPKLLNFLEETKSNRIVLELTEHSNIADYPPVLRALETLRGHEARIAIDDVGTGFAGLRHLLELHPDILKLDISITKGIDNDPMRRSLAAAVASFGLEMGLTVIAEGIETTAEATTLQRLGIGTGQGYYIGRPGPISDLARALKDATHS
jgi:EAL domain-containing protein (putative c-di-GMP-specific phosphodiesterase class I)